MWWTACNIKLPKNMDMIGIMKLMIDIMDSNVKDVFLLTLDDIICFLFMFLMEFLLRTE